MSSRFARGNKLYANIKDAQGVWRQVPTGFDVGQEAKADKRIAELEREVERQRRGESVELTVRRWVEEWSNEQKDRDVVDWKRNKAWLVDLVVPEIGDMLVREVRTPHIVAMFKKIRKAPSDVTGKPRAPRTLHNIHGVVRSMFKDAELAGHLEHAPASLDERQLGHKVDADPEWREEALFERTEIETMISSHKIPWDRRVQYAIEFLAGTRPSEAAALRWKRYDPTREPLGSLRIAKSYSARLDREKGTKTNTMRVVPVHAALAAILAEWKLTGWPEMFGREPGDDDLIIPLPPADAAARTHKTGEAFRPDYYMRRRWVESDLVELGWRHRRHYDTRATFVTLAVNDGAKAAIIRDRVTHTKPRRDGFDYYDRGDHWLETCAEVAKLKITRPRDPHANVIPMRLAAGSVEDSAPFGAVLVQREKSHEMSSTSGLRRRVSNHSAVNAGEERHQDLREVPVAVLSPECTGNGRTAPSDGAVKCEGADAGPGGCIACRS